MRLHFKEEDFIGNRYIDGRDCPIARALKREGYKNVTVWPEKVEFRKKRTLFNPFPKKNILCIGYYGLNGQILDYSRFDIFSVSTTQDMIKRGAYEDSYVYLSRD